MANKICEVRDICPWYKQGPEHCKISEVPGMFVGCRAREGILEKMSRQEGKSDEKNIIPNSIG